MNEIKSSVISAVLHQSTLYGNGARQKSFLMRGYMITHWAFAKMHLKVSMRVNFPWYGEKNKTSIGTSQYLINTLWAFKYGDGGIILWECFSLALAGRLKRKMEKNIEQSWVKPFPECSGSQADGKLTFQQDNLKHIATETQQ